VDVEIGQKHGGFSDTGTVFFQRFDGRSVMRAGVDKNGLSESGKTAIYISFHEHKTLHIVFKAIVMGLMSSSVSVSRFRVEGTLAPPVLETVENGLKANAISEFTDEAVEKAVGWTSFRSPYQAAFQNHDFVIGPYVVFSLRIDKKSIPAKVVQKQFVEASNRRLIESGRPYLSRSEKKLIRDEVSRQLIVRIPATPNVYDLIWSIEAQTVWFFTPLKSANEELESLFSRSFHLTLIRLFPFTMADLTVGLTEAERDALSRLTPTAFTV
jgi:hypothetical protein